MNRILTLLAVAALAAGLALAPTPANAGRGTPPPPPVYQCPASYMSAAELAQLHIGMNYYDVIAVVGGPGRLVLAESSPGYSVFVWDWCTDGTYYANQPLVFVGSGRGGQTLAEIR